MTRNRAAGTVPQEMAAIHYAARAGAGLIVSEATQVSARGQGYQDTPGHAHRRAGRRRGAPSPTPCTARAAACSFSSPT